MRTTIELSDALFHQLKARAHEENLTLKLLIEKSGYEYLRKPLQRRDPADIRLPVAEGGGSVLVNPATWWDDINERE